MVRIIRMWATRDDVPLGRMANRRRHGVTHLRGFCVTLECSSWNITAHPMWVRITFSSHSKWKLLSMYSNILSTSCGIFKQLKKVNKNETETSALKSGLEGDAANSLKGFDVKISIVNPIKSSLPHQNSPTNWIRHCRIVTPIRTVTKYHLLLWHVCQHCRT